MKNLLRIYLYEPKQYLYFPLGFLILYRLVLVLLPVIVPDDQTIVYSDSCWNVHYPFMILLMLLYNYVSPYQRKEMMLLPESCQRKFDSLLVYFGLHIVLFYIVLIATDLLNNAVLYFLQPERLYSPFISLQSLCHYAVSAPEDFFLIMFLLVFADVLLPVATNNRAIVMACNCLLLAALVKWLQPVAEEGDLIVGHFQNQAWVIILCLNGIIACRWLGYYCFKRRSFGDPKLFNL